MSSLFKSKTQNVTQKVDPWATMPDWMKEAYKNDAAFREQLLGNASGIAGDLAENPREIAGLTGNEMGALDSVLAGLEQYGKPDLDALLQKYQSGYTDSVVDTTLAGMERQAQRDQLAREAAAAATGGTTNTRRAVEEAVAGQLTGMNMAEMEAKLRDEAFKTGAGLSFDAADAQGDTFNRILQAAGLQGAMGETERELTQQQMDENRTAGQQAQSWLADLFAGSQYDKGPVGQTTTGEQKKPSIFSQLLGAGTSLAGAFISSDERVKEDVGLPGGDFLDKLEALQPYEYRYADGFGHTRERTTGLMAQDIERAGITGAVREVDGVKQVDPYPVLATIVGAVKELDARTRGL